MAKKYEVAVDLQKNELLNARVQNLASDPSTPVAGQLYYNSGTNRLLVYNGSSFGFTAANADLASNSTNLGGQNSAYHLNRANHTGTDTAASISDFSEAATDAAGAALVAGTHTGITATYGATQDTANRIDLAVTDSPLLGGQTLAQVRARSSHTGTQTASTISDFDTQVRTSRLDQMAAPTAAVALNNQKITGLAAGTSASDAATFGQLEAVRTGVVKKAHVEAAMTTNVTISNPGTATFDGVTLAAGERILLTGQTTASENGIYVWTATGTAMTRADDADTFGEIDAGTETYAQGGTTNSGVWRQTTELTAFTGQVWIKAQGGTTYTAGSGLTESPAGTFNVGAAADNTLTVTADAVGVNTGLVARYKTFTIGDAAATSFVLNHALANQWVTAQVIRNSSPFDEPIVDIERTDANNVTVRFTNAPALNAFKVVVVG